MSSIQTELTPVADNDPILDRLVYSTADAKPLDYATDRPFRPLSKDGFIMGRQGPDTLAEAFRRREAGASLKEIRHDLCLTGDRSVSDAELERAIDGSGRMVLDYFVNGRVTSAVERKVYAGIGKLPGDLAREQAEAKAAAAQVAQTQQEQIGA